MDLTVRDIEQEEQGPYRGRKGKWNMYFQAYEVRMVKHADYQVPALPTYYIPQPEQNTVLQHLVNIVPRPIYLCGDSGRGKSTLAHWLGQQPGLFARYPDGVHYLEFAGDESTPLSRLKMLANSCGVKNSSRLGTAKAAVDKLAGILQHKRVLIMVDNAWNKAQVSPFLTLSSSQPSIGLLITTRFSELALGFEIIQVEGLISAELTTQLLNRVSRKQLTEEPGFEALVQKCNGLPSLIRAVGNRCKRFSCAEVLERWTKMVLRFEIPTEFDRALFSFYQQQVDALAVRRFESPHLLSQHVNLAVCCEWLAVIVSAADNLQVSTVSLKDIWALECFNAQRTFVVLNGSAVAAIYCERASVLWDYLEDWRASD